MMKKLVSFVLLITTLLQSCFAYQKTLVSMDKARNSEKLKIALKGGEEIWFDIISQMDNVYYGVDKERKRLDGNAKNAIYGSAGIGIFHQYSAGFSYERKISGEVIDMLMNMKGAAYSNFIRVSVGQSSYPSNSEGNYFSSEIGALLGKKKSHLEVAVGVGVFVDGYDKTTSVGLSGFVGYRYQNPSGGLIFRTGLGVPELIYVGIGVSF